MLKAKTWQHRIHAATALIRRRLARITSSQRFLPEVDGLRFVAIIAVLCYHVNGYLVTHSQSLYLSGKQELICKLLSLGNFGVQLFFSLSGFILGWPFAEQLLNQGRTVRLSQYFWRRITRIEPPYIVALLVYFSLELIAHKITWHTSASHLLASLFYCHNAIYKNVRPIIPVAWSLEVEVQFYILAPFLALIFLIRQPILRRGLLIAATALAATFSIKIRELNLAQFLHYFLVGFLLADLYVCRWKATDIKRISWDLVGLAGWLVIVPLLWLQWTIPAVTQLLAPACIFLAYCAAFRGRLSNWLFRQALLVTVGGMCYTIYLYHMLIVSAVARWSIKIAAGPFYWTNAIVQIVLISTAVIVLSSPLYLITEKPFMVKDWPQRLRNLLTGRKRPVMSLDI